ncbi:MAG: glycosyltransferase family 4 protein [Terriglobales bacterium]
MDRAWRVIHACDSIRSVAELVEAQIAAGMRPFVLTGEAPPRPGSLLETWNEVRAWRSYLEGVDAPGHPLQSSVVHAHSFPSAMAAVRAGLTTVYDVHACVEDFAVTAGQCAERSWLARSFRTAEEFLLPRAGAVVVHYTLMREACLERGVGEADLFFVPTPLHLPAASGFDTGWLRRAFDFSADIVTIFARPTAADDETLLRAFAQTAAEVPGTRLFIAAGDDQTAPLRRFAHEHAVEELTFFLSREDVGPALAAADIVLAGWPVFPDDSSWGRMHAMRTANSGTALAAMAHGRCLLAADCSAHRDLTPQGRGCLWYGSGAMTSDSKDKASGLAHRLAFLARNPDFRRALAENARQHLAQTRDPEGIGKQYREVYRHAELRRHHGDDAPGHTPIMVPSQAST